VNPIAQLFEAALFSADHPLSVDELRRLAGSLGEEEVRGAIEELRRQYETGGHGIEVVELGEGFQVVSRRELADAIAEAHLVTRPRKLSRAALETLAVIAYRQPVSRAQVEEIRGVSVEGVLRSLMERGLVEVVGRAEGLGRPLLYGTTPVFLELLAIRSLDELPRLEELSVALSPQVESLEVPEQEVEAAEAGDG
jgi:segregation and condensation protein B